MKNNNILRVIIVGAGFAGLTTANKLKSRKDLNITIVDNNNYHVFQPFLYQVASADLSPSDIAVPVRTQFAKYKNITVLKDKVIRINKRKNIIYTENKLSLSFDYLIVAVGSVSNYYNQERWGKNTFALKTLYDALIIRNKVLSIYEEAELRNNTKKTHLSPTTLIIGGGATGVEMAGALAELVYNTMKHDFRNFPTSLTKIILLEGGSSLLPTFDSELSDYAFQCLEKKGVEIRLNSKVKDIKENHVLTSKGEEIKADIIVWAAGVKAAITTQLLGRDVLKNLLGQVIVEKDLTLPSYPSIYVIGDSSLALDNIGRPLPHLASVAVQQGKFVAKAIIQRILQSKNNLIFEYKDLGNLAVIGRYGAIADIQGFKFKGIIAWVIWSIVHIYYLIGFKNRLIIFIKWMWYYVTHGKSERIIITGKST
jgi:NADH dehydrogenase